MNLLGISGSLRRDSANTALLRAAAEAAGPARFVLADLNLPLYDGDVEAAGMPPAVAAFAAAIAEADAVVIATPEYNKGISGVLKNALDWQSRVRPVPLAGKPVAIVSAAAGRSGGEVAQYMLRHCLAAFSVRLVGGPPVLVANPPAAFTDGRLTDAAALKLLADQMAALRAEVARA